MYPFQRILVYAPLEDETFMALDQAASIARENNASLTIMRVLENGVGWGRWKLRRDEPADLYRFLEDSQHELLDARVAPLRDEGLEVGVEVRWGTPWLELIRSVLHDGHDLVVKTAEGVSRARGLLFGSTAMHLIRKCPRPVWVVTSPHAETRRRVLAAIDPTDDETRLELARRILNLSAAMAGDEGELHAVSVWRAVGETLLRNRVLPEELSEQLDSAREEARAVLDSILLSAGEPVKLERVHLLKGHARDVLPEFIDSNAFDLVVVGSLGRVGIAGLLIGETAETLIRSLRCSVLVVKPPGFVTPVEL
jgi:nucleotide-binding universal stress UspA family protein